MSRATLEVADIIRAAGDTFWEKHGCHLAWPHRKVLDSIARCRTAALGGHRDQCVRCGHHRASSEAMFEMARDPKHLGAEIGFLGVLHTWGQNLEHHAHVHYIVPAGGLAPDGSNWITASARFFLPVKALSRMFRGKFTESLLDLYKRDKLQFLPL